MPRPSLTYVLSHAVIAAHLGTGILCLAPSGEGRAYRLHAERPGPGLNRRAVRCDGGRVEWRLFDQEQENEERLRKRADLPSGANHKIQAVEPASPLVRVDISGALEQRAGWVECEGYVDGHDAIADRLCAAFAEGDVLLVVDSPGGAAAGLQQAVERALAAKAHHGRRVTVFADEMIGSAAMWWACALGDELYIPTAGQVGSIGARGQHTSIKGALDKEGVLVTYFADPPEKVCFAPERLPDEETIRRGTRDVTIAADAFRAAICASPIGTRNGLTPEYLIGLGADMLTGQEAVDAGLADGVESFEAVVAYALTLAESEPGAEARETATKITGSANGAAKGDTMGLRANSGAPPGARAEDEKKEEEKGGEPTGKCSHCGMQNEDDAKFCDQCGKSMAAKKMAGDDDDDDKEPPSSKGPPSSERKSDAAHPPPPERMSAPRKMSATASTAAILGASADTPLAIKTAAIDMRQERDWLKATLAGITGKDETAEMIGAALNIPGKIAEGKRVAAELAGLRAKQDDAERWQLADRLVNVAPHMRSKVLADLHDDAGPRITNDKTGRSVRIRSKYAAMDLGVFRGIVSDLEGDAPKPRRNPFEADKDAAKAASEQALAEMNGGAPRLGPGGKPTEAQIKAVTDNMDKHPALAGMWRARGNDPKLLPALAEQYILATAQTGTTPKGVYG